MKTHGLRTTPLNGAQANPRTGPQSGPTDISTLEDNLSSPPAGLIEMFARLHGDIIVIGAAGKMGPTLTRMARRAADAAGTKRRVIAAARFTDEATARAMEAQGIETAKGDLLDPSFIESLPEAPLVVYAAGMKFGSTGNEPLTWATNTHLPTLICRKYARSRIVAFSTGNVYGVVPSSRRSVETDAVNPVGEYAMSCLGRERMFQYFSQALGVSVALLRLNYATELRYGVIVDLAQKIWAGEPIDVTMGYANVIWQTDANAIALGLLEHTASPAAFFNIAGPEVFRVRDVCAALGELMERQVRFIGEEAPDALLSRGDKAAALVGGTNVALPVILEWTADWVKRNGATLGKPTHFEVRNGRF
ncbi:MAG: NAD(P)-dependent oxidoreductase [Planctomycetes bacterium]|nr:NAD(P)-dependent oxidoreductase [Planctomycetota bacterium]